VIGDVSWNVPTVSGDRLLMRNATQAACLKLKMTKTNLARSAYQESHEVAFDAGTAAAILGSTIQR
jgi:hypothetical protein